MGKIGLVTLVVDDYDEALDFYTRVVGFELLEDIPLGDKRWVVVRPRGSGGTALLLAKAVDERQRSRIGDQTGGRVAFFLESDDFTSDYERMRGAGVSFLEDPRSEEYGQVAVFEDLYGNRWDLIEYLGAR
jgi:catechol 2,3-dioxygenase-like lactoylglutathione lyase family enzyme